MLKINREIANQLVDIGNVGIFCSEGAVIGEAQFVIVYKEEKLEVYLAHISEFEQDGLLIRIRKKNEN